MSLNYEPKKNPSDSDDSKCNSLSGSDDVFNYWEPLNNNPEKGLRIKVGKGDKCGTDSNYEVDFNLVCNPNLPDKTFNVLNTEEINLSKCKIFIVAESKHGINFIL